MTFRDRISLIWNYGKWLFLIGGVYNVVCAFFLSRSFSYAGFVDSFILKALLTVVSLYLIKQFQARDAVFFYINLGLSRRKMLVSVLLVDFLILAILLTVILLLNG